MRVFLSFMCLSLAPGAVWAQESAPAFEVASIKPAAPQDRGRRSVRMRSNAGRIDFANVSLDDVLTRAYGVKRSQIVGPNWLFTERYDIAATIPEGTGPELVPAMFQQLLQERFRMKVRIDLRDEKVYALVVGKGGPKLKASETADRDGRDYRSSFPNAGKDGEDKSGRMEVGSNGIAQLQANGVTLERFADNLSKLLDRPVMNQTGIEGTYDFTLDISGEDMAHARDRGKSEAGAVGSPEGRDVLTAAVPSTSIFAAVRQYGLRLESSKAPLKYVVVETADRVPSQN